jgi:hypothetical protein
MVNFSIHFVFLIIRYKINKLEDREDGFVNSVELL